MKYKNTLLISLLATLLCTGGCGTIGSKISLMVSTPEQKHQLAAGLEYLRAGNEKQAYDMLERIVAAPPLEGVTDEAFFRVALFHLGADGEKGIASAQALLEHLKIKYPKSIWTHQAAPLASHLAGAKNLRDKERELRTLREQNLSLSRDNKELRQSIERLKNLDLELEQKIRR